MFTWVISVHYMHSTHTYMVTECVEQNANGFKRLRRKSTEKETWTISARQNKQQQQQKTKQVIQGTWRISARRHRGRVRMCCFREVFQHPVPGSNLTFSLGQTHKTNVLHQNNPLTCRDMRWERNYKVVRFEMSAYRRMSSLMLAALASLLSSLPVRPSWLPPSTANIPD